jgi:hypothetical protein
VSGGEDLLVETPGMDVVLRRQSLNTSTFGIITFLADVQITSEERSVVNGMMRRL